MTSLQIGRHRTGGFLLWTIIESLQRRSGQTPRSFIKNHYFQTQKDRWPNLSIDHFKIDYMSVEDDGIFCDVEILLRERLMDVASYVSSCSHVWSDSVYHPRHSEVLPLFDGIIYQLRDPRDSLISLADWEFKPYRMTYGWKRETTPADFIENRLETFMEGWQDHVVGYRKIFDAHGVQVIKYEELTNNFDVTLAKIAHTCGVVLTPELLKDVRSDASLDNMRQRAPEHVQAGIAGRYKQRLTRDQLNRVDAICGPLLADLGY